MMILRLPWPAQTPSGDVLDFLAYSSSSGPCRLKPVNQNHLVFIDERALVGLPNYTLEAIQPTLLCKINLRPWWINYDMDECAKEGMRNECKRISGRHAGMDGWMDGYCAVDNEE